MVVGNHNIARISQHVYHFWEYGIVWGVHRKESRIRQRCKLTKAILRKIYLINIGHIICMIYERDFLIWVTLDAIRNKETDPLGPRFGIRHNEDIGWTYRMCKSS